ncbi:MAG: hypothetical protein AABZ23_03610 [Deltaproteobacteria bacterium]
MLKQRLVNFIFMALMPLNVIFIASCVFLRQYAAILPAAGLILLLVAARLYLQGMTLRLKGLRACIKDASSGMPVDIAEIQDNADAKGLIEHMTVLCRSMDKENSLVREILEELRIAVFDIDESGARPLNNAAGALLRDMDPGLVKAAVAEAFSGGEIRRMPLSIPLNDNAEKDIRISALPIETPLGIKAVRVIAFDAYERLMLAKELKAAKDDVIENQKRLKKTIEDLEEFALLAIRREQKMVEIRKRLAAENSVDGMETNA